MLSRRQMLPASGHFGTSSARTKLVTDAAPGTSGTDKIAVETHIVILAMIHLPGFSDFFVFRLTHQRPASATVCTGSA